MNALPTERRPPGPPPRRGIVSSLRYYAAFARDPVGFVADRFVNYGDIYCAPTKDGRLFVLKHPDHIREVLVTRAASFTKKHTALTALSSVLGEGLLTTDGESWKRQRRMVQPAFSPARMAGYADVMTEEAARTSELWRRGGPLNMTEEMSALTLRIVSRTLFGHGLPEADIRAFGEGMSAFQRSLASSDVLPSWLPTPARFDTARSLRKLDGIIHALIDARRAAPSSGASQTDLLELLLNAVDVEGQGGALTVAEVRDQLMTLFLAGHETTANALTWTWACLARNPRCEAALHAELDAVLGGRAPSVGDLDRLPYTEQVVSEAMRLYPPVYVIARAARDDTEIGGYPVPSGSEVIVWVYMTHRDPRFFPDPEAFVPERFSKEQASRRPALAYMPFGAGPRACIGKAFALMEARLLLATLAQHHRVTLAKGQSLKVNPRITLTPAANMRMIVSSRQA